LRRGHDLDFPDEPNGLSRGTFRFFFFSREEERLHIHIQSAYGEAKFWVEPRIELARSHGLRRVRELIEEREQEIRDAWASHFGS
jgi:hypothetical protein